MSIDIFCLPLSTLVLSSFMTWYGLWMSNTMDTPIESGSPFPSRAHAFSLCYQWGSYWLFCLPTCFHIFSHISYIHVKPCSILLCLDLCCHGFMFYLMLHYISIYLRILVSNAISISTNGHTIFVLCSVWRDHSFSFVCPFYSIVLPAFRFTAYDNPVLYRQTFLFTKTHMAFRKVNQYMCIDPYTSIFKDNMNI